MSSSLNWIKQRPPKAPLEVRVLVGTPLLCFYLLNTHSYSSFYTYSCIYTIGNWTIMFQNKCKKKSMVQFDKKMVGEHNQCNFTERVLDQKSLSLSLLMGWSSGHLYDTFGIVCLYDPASFPLLRSRRVVWWHSLPPTPMSSLESQLQTKPILTSRENAKPSIHLSLSYTLYATMVPVNDYDFKSQIQLIL